MSNKNVLSALDALNRLQEGNERYLTAERNDGDISPSIRCATCAHGQSPYTIVVTCSDSRVIPENIFMSGIGELFVIRTAGNVIGAHELGSIEYAAEHLGCKLTVVLGHTHCGAVGTAIDGGAEGYVKCITDEICLAIGKEREDAAASRLNALAGVRKIKESLKDKLASDIVVTAAVYDIKSGKVSFF